MPKLHLDKVRNAVVHYVVGLDPVDGVRYRELRADGSMRKLDLQGVEYLSAAEAEETSRKWRSGEFGNTDDVVVDAANGSRIAARKPIRVDLGTVKIETLRLRAAPLTLFPDEFDPARAWRLFTGPRTITQDRLRLQDAWPAIEAPDLSGMIPETATHLVPPGFGGFLSSVSSRAAMEDFLESVHGRDDLQGSELRHVWQAVKGYPEFSKSSYLLGAFDPMDEKVWRDMLDIRTTPLWLLVGFMMGRERPPENTEEKRQQRIKEFAAVLEKFPADERDVLTKGVSLEFEERILLGGVAKGISAS